MFRKRQIMDENWKGGRKDKDEVGKISGVQPPLCRTWRLVWEQQEKAPELL